MGDGSREQRGQDTGAMEDNEDEGASSSDNLHQTVEFAHAPAPAPGTACTLTALFLSHPLHHALALKNGIKARYVCRQGRVLEILTQVHSSDAYANGEMTLLVH